MNLDRIINKGSFILGLLGLIAIILTGLLGQERTSVIILGLVILLWLSWITYRLFILSKEMHAHQPSSTVVSEQPSLPYEAFYRGFETEARLIACKKDKIKIPATFLTWPTFSMVFWAEITEEFFSSHNNRYLFSYTTNDHSSSKYPNAFYLGLLQHGDEWKFVIKGDDPSNSNHYQFRSGHNLIGWRLFAIRWQTHDRKLDFSIDAGHVFRDNKAIPKTHWPVPESQVQFHLGGWTDRWDGGLSLLRFFNFRIYKRYLSDNDLETLLAQEGESLVNV